MIEHNFDDSLRASKQQANEPYWEEIYRRAFPAFKSMAVADRGLQRLHVDRIITIDNGHTFNVEEKVRPRDWPDFALEFWSSEEDRRPGWMSEDGHADFIAYTFLQYRRCWVLPWPALRLAWRLNSEQWIAQHGTIRAKNTNYTTVCCPVPIPTVIRALTNTYGIGWGTRNLNDGWPLTHTEPVHKSEQQFLPDHVGHRHGGGK